MFGVLVFLDDVTRLLRMDVKVVSPLEEFLDLQVLVLRHVEMLDLLGLDAESLATHQITHVPDGHSVVGWQVGSDLMGEEVVHLLLVSHLGGEVLCRYPHLPIGQRVDLLPFSHS